MATFISALFSLCLLSFANCLPVTDDSPINITVPAACRGKDFCSVRPDNYEEIQARIRKLIPKIMLTQVEDRDGEDGDWEYSPKEDWQNCPTYKRTEKPSWAWSPIKKKFYYVPQDKDFKQTFVAVRCPVPKIAKISNNSTVRQCFPDLHLSETKSTCEQRSAWRWLYIYDDVNDKLIFKPYEIPVHCSCQLTSSTF